MSASAPAGLPIATGRPCVIVPLVSGTLSGLRDELTALRGSPAQLVEWRADLYTQATSLGDIIAVLRELGAELAGAATADQAGAEQSAGDRAASQADPTSASTPLLFTYRTQAEGGRGIAHERDYAMLIEAVAGAGVSAAVDVEYAHPLGPTVIDIARSEGADVIASAHDFTATAPTAQLVETLAGMQTAGADVAKIAVTPTCPADVVRLLEATVSARAQLDIPIITVAMGPLGLVTRLAGEVFGSAATFATVGEPSAPGQIDADTVSGILDLFHQQLHPRQ